MTPLMSVIAPVKEKVILLNKAKDLTLSSCSPMIGEGTQAPTASSKVKTQSTKLLIPQTSIESLLKELFLLMLMSLLPFVLLAEVPYSLELTSGKLDLEPSSMGPDGTNRYQPIH